MAKKFNVTTPYGDGEIEFNHGGNPSTAAAVLQAFNGGELVLHKATGGQGGVFRVTRNATDVESRFVLEGVYKIDVAPANPIPEGLEPIPVTDVQDV